MLYKRTNEREESSVFLLKYWKKKSFKQRECIWKFWRLMESEGEKEEKGGENEVTDLQREKEREY